jgi:glycosyltransferase involved in cell wall biosynthesis
VRSRPPSVGIYSTTAAVGGVEAVGLRSQQALDAAGMPARLHTGLTDTARSRRPRGTWMAMTWKVHALVTMRHPGCRSGGLLWVHGAELLRDDRAVTTRLRARALHRADALLAVSPFVVDLVPELRDRITLIGPPVPPAPSLVPVRTEPYTPGTRALRLLSVGRAEPRKGHDTAIAVARQLSAAGPVRLDVVGPGPDLARLRALAADAPSPADIRIHGGVPERDKDRLYHEADALLFLTRREGTEFDGLGLVVLEAAARGCPAVVLESGGTRFTVADGRSGRVINGDSPVPAIATAVMQVVTDPSARTAARRYSAQFCLRDWSDRLVAAVEGRPVDWAWPSLPPDGSLADASLHHRVGTTPPIRLR